MGRKGQDEEYTRLYQKTRTQARDIQGHGRTHTHTQHTPMTKLQTYTHTHDSSPCSMHFPLRAPRIVCPHTCPHTHIPSFMLPYSLGLSRTPPLRVERRAFTHIHTHTHAIETSAGLSQSSNPTRPPLRLLLLYISFSLKHTPMRRSSHTHTHLRSLLFFFSPSTTADTPPPCACVCVCVCVCVQPALDAPHPKSDYRSYDAPGKRTSPPALASPDGACHSLCVCERERE